MSDGLSRDELLVMQGTRTGRGDGRQSYGQRLTARKNGMLATGRHPATRLAVKNDEQCGTCVHCIGNRHNAKTYYKCDRVAITSGPVTDIRLSWPACQGWEARP